MTAPQGREIRAQALSEVNARLLSEPDAVPLLFRRGVLLDELDDVDAAKNDYIAVLRRDPNHFGAMNNLATLLCRLGYQTAAIPIFAETIKQYPLELAARVNFGNVLVNLGHLAEAREQFEAAISIRPDSRSAHQGLGNVLSAIGEESRAREHWKLAFSGNAISISPFFGAEEPVRVLTLYSQTDGNVPVEALLDSRRFQLIKVTVEYFDDDSPLPPHHVVFSAVGDADRCPEAFDDAQRVLKHTSAPVVNHPAKLAQTSRSQVSQRLCGVQNVVTAKTVRFARSELSGPRARSILEQNGFAFPLLLRAPGFHTGQHFVRVDTMDEFAVALERLPGSDVLVLNYLDSRGADGKFRKYRVMFVGGNLYPLHAAVSTGWKVHYFSADMNESAEHRAEDEAFLADASCVLGEQAMKALRDVQALLGMDYGGIDFALDEEGRVLLFEANATMRVTRPPADPRWTYRQPAVSRVFEAVTAMMMTAHAERSHSPAHDPSYRRKEY